MERKGRSKSFRGEKNIADQDHVRGRNGSSCVSGVECEDSAAVWLLDAALTAETAPLTSICVRKWLQFEYFSNNEM